MWPLWLIITVAVGGAVSLTVTAVVTVVHLERKRHRRLMTQHMLERRTSQMHRHHLSITEVDISGLPRPKKSLRSSYQRPRSDSVRFYSTIPSQEEIRTFPEGSITDSVVDMSHCQPDTSRPLQWLSPSKSKKLKRKKKLAKVSISAPVAKSPMSAITEATESSRKATPEPIELPAQATPKLTPENNLKARIPMSIKILQDSRASVDGVLGLPNPNEWRVSQRVSHGTTMKSRSISAGSIMPPPTIPLPPVPHTMPGDHHRRTSLSKSKSDTSLHSRSASALHMAACELPVAATPKPIGSLTGFRFELTDQQILSNAVDPGIAKQSSQFEGSRGDAYSQFRFPQPATEVVDPNKTLQTVHANTWDIPKAPRVSQPVTPVTPNFSMNTSPAGSRSVSMIDYDAICSASGSLNNSPTKPHDRTVSRPASAMSISSADMFRLSVIGAAVPASPRTKGHKRQNCIRIKSLTPIEAKRRLSSQLGRLAEAEEDNVLSSSPSPDCTDNAQSVLPYKASSGVPIIKQPQTSSLRVKRPGWVSIKDKNRQIRPLPVISDAAKQNIESSQFGFDEPSAHKEGCLGEVRGSEVPPTVLEATQTSGVMGSSPPSAVSQVSSAVSPQRQKTHIRGPRDAPVPSLRVRNQTRTGSPLRRQSSETDRISKHHSQQQRERKASGAELRKSIALLKVMTLPEPLQSRNVEDLEATSDKPLARTPSSRYADSPSLKVAKNRMRSNTVAGHGTRTHPSYIADQTPNQRKGTVLHVRTETPLTAGGKLTYSPSSISIWEDASVKGDSPEPRARREPSALHHSSAPAPLRQTSPNQPRTDESTRDEPERYSPVKSHREHFDQLSMYSRNMSLHHHRAGQSPPIQRESLWKLQQDADMVTSRALALSTTTASTNHAATTGRPSPLLQQGKRVIGPKAKLQGLYDHQSTNLRSSTAHSAVSGTDTIHDPPVRTRRSHTVSAAARPSPRFASEGVGLGLMLGDKSMAYTVNDMERDSIGRLR